MTLAPQTKTRLLTIPILTLTRTKRRPLWLQQMKEHKADKSEDKDKRLKKKLDVLREQIGEEGARFKTKEEYEAWRKEEYKKRHTKSRRERKGQVEWTEHMHRRRLNDASMPTRGPAHLCAIVYEAAEMLSAAGFLFWI